jgi:hypothetical protein
MDQPRTSPQTGLLRKQHTLAEQYVQKILPADPREAATGTLAYVSVDTKISYTESGVARTAHCEAFDAALARIIRAEFERLAMMALVQMHRAAQVDEPTLAGEAHGTL